MKILVCDDSRFTRQRINDYLSGLNCTIILAENGQMGLDLIKSEKPDLVLLDLLMPILDGIQVLEQLQEMDDRTPVVVISADIQNATVDRCIELGAKAFLHKPPAKEIMLNTVRQILNL
jgi:CheY-like chemotaxis protein